MRRKLSGLNYTPKSGNTVNVLVEEQCMEAEALTEVGVDDIQERMPA